MKIQTMLKTMMESILRNLVHQTIKALINLRYKLYVGSIRGLIHYIISAMASCCTLSFTSVSSKPNKPSSSSISSSLQLPITPHLPFSKSSSLHPNHTLLQTQCRKIPLTNSPSFLQEPLRIMISGAPASGKDTQCELITKKIFGILYKVLSPASGSHISRCLVFEKILLGSHDEPAHNILDPNKSHEVNEIQRYLNVIIFDRHYNRFSCSVQIKGAYPTLKHFLTCWFNVRAKEATYHTSKKPHRKKPITMPPVQQKTFVPFSSKLATMSPAIPSTSSVVSMADTLKFRPEVITAYEKINKFYDYKTNPDILRSAKLSKYPRFICSERANSNIVERLFTYGFIDKIVTDDKMNNLTKLPQIITRSTELMMESFGKGIYGIQILDASTDLKGKPIIICQNFKTGRNSTINGEDKNLNQKILCTLEKFQDWMSTKRAFGLITLKTRIEDMIRNRKASVIGSSKGGDVEEIMTLYYDNDIEVKETTELTLLLDKITNLKHTHAEETIRHYKSMTEQRKRPVIRTKTASSSTVSIKKEQSPDPFE
ncbi:hypothetical protein RND71_032196 [Anisodus tanguticus]|uniref:Uncharacterized protein n=1 Tax=Anisodus tanguticus TaxID=243964 RepID=A0AAE1RCR8_9SOLA|nr:hypothetical protein RND71_032196 [Anisodus tanguticus]